MLGLPFILLVGSPLVFSTNVKNRITNSLDKGSIKDPVTIPVILNQNLNKKPMNTRLGKKIDNIPWISSQWRPSNGWNKPGITPKAYNDQPWNYHMYSMPDPGYMWYGQPEYPYPYPPSEQYPPNSYGPPPDKPPGYSYPAPDPQYPPHGQIPYFYYPITLHNLEKPLLDTYGPPQENATVGPLPLDPKTNKTGPTTTAKPWVLPTQKPYYKPYMIYPPGGGVQQQYIHINLPYAFILPPPPVFPPPEKTHQLALTTRNTTSVERITTNQPISITTTDVESNEENFTEDSILADQQYDASTVEESIFTKLTNLYNEEAELVNQKFNSSEVW